MQSFHTGHSIFSPFIYYTMQVGKFAMQVGKFAMQAGKIAMQTGKIG